MQKTPTASTISDTYIDGYADALKEFYIALGAKVPPRHRLIESGRTAWRRARRDARRTPNVVDLGSGRANGAREEAGLEAATKEKA